MKKKWFKLSDTVTIELSGVRDAHVGDSTYLYVKYVGERRATGYPMGSKSNALAVLERLSDALVTFGDSQ